MKGSRKRKIIVWTTILIVVFVIVSLAAVVGIWIMYQRSWENLPVTAADRDVVVDINDLARHMDGFTPESKGTITKTRYKADVYGIEYTYGSIETSAPFLNCWVTVELDANTAAMNYQGRLFRFQFPDADVTVAERNDLFQWGEESQFAVIEYNGQPFGNFFVARKGNRVFSIIISGVSIDDSASIQELLAEPLSRLSSYVP